MDLLSCKAGDWTFAVGHADVGRPDEASRALATMRSALLVNAGGRQTAAQAVSVPGMADDPAAQRIAVRGRNADGGPIEVQAQFFSHDGQVFQASVLGRGVVASDAAQTFFDGLHWLAERRS